MNFSRTSGLERLAEALVEGARLELHLTPKPGLVDLWDSGSHPDLSLALMEESLGMVACYLRELAGSLGRGEPFVAQVEIAKRTEVRMRAALGTNTHKGYLFLSGFLLIARWHAPSSDIPAVREAIRSLARRFFTDRAASDTNGENARVRYRVGGIVREARKGFPSLFEEALPAYASAIARHGSPRTARFHVLARLMQTVEDTTALHRCGAEGLRRIRRDGRTLERLIDGGGDFDSFLLRLNREYVALNLTMGGVADLLGLALGYLAFLNPDYRAPAPVASSFANCSRATLAVSGRYFPSCSTHC